MLYLKPVQLKRARRLSRRLNAPNVRVTPPRQSVLFTSCVRVVAARGRVCGGVGRSVYVCLSLCLPLGNYLCTENNNHDKLEI